jgi:zinc/manganese transport system substrate-binding protein
LDRVGDDVGDVLVAERVARLTATALDRVAMVGRPFPSGTCIETQSQYMFYPVRTHHRHATRAQLGTLWRDTLLALVSLPIAAGLLVPVWAVAPAAPAAAASTPGVIKAIGTENEYADVLSQIGGKYVRVSSILNNPNTDPHTYEASPSVAQEVSAASLIVQNGVGYDTFMNKIESATPNSARKVLVVQHLLGLPDNTPNPHLWYSPTTMPKVAKTMATQLSMIQPSHASYFAAKLARFDTSLGPWMSAISAFRAKYAGTTVATTEPVADYLLTAMGLHNLTPFRFQADIMSGVDPAPQDITLEDGFFTKHQVKVFCYNQQVVSSLTSSIRLTAQHAGVPVVGVYETMPTPGYDYQTWMLAEVKAIQAAITHRVSTEHL